jgi:hypothetical protein
MKRSIEKYIWEEAKLYDMLINEIEMQIARAIAHPQDSLKLKEQTKKFLLEIGTIQHRISPPEKK